MAIGKKELNKLLYHFLETIYTFQQLETQLFDVNWQEIYLMKHISENGTKTVGEISTLLKVPLFHGSRIIQRLGDKGIVSKQKDRNNQRIVLVDLTDKGRNLIQDIEDYHYNLILGNLNVLNENELNGIMSGLTKLKNLLSLEGE